MMACEVPLTQGPNKGKPATGSSRGYRRHREQAEEACAACLAAVAAENRGYDAANRDTVRAAKRAWYYANHERALELSRKWYSVNRDQSVAATRRWQDNHPGQNAESKRRWAAENPDRIRAAAKRWVEAHPEKLRETRRVHGSARRAREKSAYTIPFTAAQLAARMAFWGNRCWMCGGEYQEVDHVKPLAAGGAHCLSNLRPSCRSCNASKNAKWLGVCDLGAVLSAA